MITKPLVLLFFLHSSLQASSPSSPTYEAGVVEFNYGLGQGKTPQQLLDENIKEYVQFMSEAPSTLDIIVFPEGTLNLLQTAVEIPESKDNMIPCSNSSFEDDNLLKFISCSAISHKRYVVINAITKSKCPDDEMIANQDPRKCSETKDGYSYYNTNIVFNRVGAIVSIYRKFNLFGETLDRPLKPAIVKFETDFGVTFGHFICFDMLFKYPAAEMIRKHNITDVIFTSKWFSELPFLTAVQVQQYWSHSLNINMLASGANFPSYASTGSGIYGGNKGAYRAGMSQINKSKLYTAKVYKKIQQNDNIKIKHELERYTKTDMKTLSLWRDQLDVYTIEFLNEADETNNINKKICNGTLCCDFKVNYAIKNSEVAHYQYAIAFYYGNRTFSGVVDTAVAACAIIACPQRDIKTCGKRDEKLANIHEWKSIEINGEFPMKKNQYLYMPSTLDENILPLQPEQFVYEVENGKKGEIKVVMRLNNHIDNLLTFGIWGRDFSDEPFDDEEDGEDKDKDDKPDKEDKDKDKPDHAIGIYSSVALICSGFFALVLLL